MNNNSFYIFGLMRSGNHAIIEWLSSMMNTPLHLNNLYPNSMYIENHFDLNKAGLIDNLNECEDFIVSYENVPLNKMSDIVSMNAVFKLHNPAYKKIIIIRDVLNWSASLYKHKIQTGLDINIKILLSHWRKYFQLSKEENDFLFINYNKWTSNEEYRKEIANQLHLNYSSKTLNTLARFGSSFFDSLNDTGSEDFNSRWKLLLNNEEYLHILKDDIGMWFIKQIAPHFDLDITDLKL